MVKRLVSILGAFLLIGFIFVGCGSDQKEEVIKSDNTVFDFSAKDGAVEVSEAGDIMEVTIRGSADGYPMEDGRTYRHENTVLRNIDTGEESPIRRIYFDTRWLEKMGVHQPIVIELSQKQMDKIKDFLDDYITVQPQARRGSLPGGSSGGVAIYIDGVKVDNASSWYLTISFRWNDKFHRVIGGRAGRCRGGDCWDIGCSVGNSPNYGNLISLMAVLFALGLASFVRHKQ